MLGSLLKQLFRRQPAAPAGTPPSPVRNADEDGLPWRDEALQLQRLRRYAEAADVARSALDREPGNADALQVLAAALLAQGNSGEGIACLRRAAALAPGSAQAQATLASVLARTGDLSGAIEGYRRAAQLEPSFADAWASLALLLNSLARYDEAEACCRSGLAADAGHAALRHTYSTVLFEQGRVDEAIAEARAALALAPEPHVHTDLVRMLNYSEAQDPEAIYRESRAWAERYAAPLERAAPPPDNDPDPARRLRVGYVSPHLRRHAVAFFLESVIGHHDPAQTEVILYADVAQPDEYSRRLQSYGAAWRQTAGMTDEQFAALIRRDRMDILVDLTGQTPQHRLLAFARRPAPVQVTWSGYPNTTGLTAMDYRISDDWCDPPGTTEHLHSEKLVRLPVIYQAWRPPSEAPAVAPLPALRSGRITFGSFNSCYKVTPGTVALWSRLLARVPGSRLLLLDVTGERAAERYRALFAQHGVDPARIDIRPRMPFEAFLAVHAEADIALDTFPYHGTTTTCFSLWMGLPVVTLEGTIHLSRVGVSFLNNLGAPDWVAKSPDEYVEIAVRLAANLPELERLRAGLRDKMLHSSLTDGRGCARALDRAFRDMWTAWCRSRQECPPEAGARESRNIVVKSQYGPVVVNRHDNMIGRAIAEQGSWEKDEIELLRWVVTASYGGETEVELLDVGAYIGVYAIAFAGFAFPRVTVHAFEPQGEIFRMLTETVALNRLDNVRCHHNAVSSESGQLLRFRAVDYDQPANFASLEMEAVPNPDFDGMRREDATETVETIRIDDLALARVRLMKIDAEGMEHKVLAGAADTIRRCRPLIFLEYEKTDFDAVKSFLRAAGYRSYYAQRPNILCIPDELDRVRIKGAVRVRY